MSNIFLCVSVCLYILICILMFLIETFCNTRDCSKLYIEQK